MIRVERTFYQGKAQTATYEVDADRMSVTVNEGTVVLTLSKVQGSGVSAVVAMFHDWDCAYVDEIATLINPAPQGPQDLQSALSELDAAIARRAQESKDGS